MRLSYTRDQQIITEEKKIKQRLNLPPATGVRLVPGISYGLNEVVKGIVRMFPHKKSYALIKGTGPYWTELIYWLSVEGLSPQFFDIKNINQSGEWIESLNKDTLFLLDSLNDPITAQVFSLTELHQQLHARKIFSISVDHFALEQAVALNPFEVRVLKNPNNLATLLMGSRSTRIQPLVAGTSDWFSTGAMLEGLNSYSEHQMMVKDFESRLEEGFLPLLNKNTKRIYDRAVIYHPQIDGQAVMEALGRELNLKWNTPGLEDRVETLSLCRWNALKDFDWYEAQGISLENLSGTLIIDAQFLTPQVSLSLWSAVQKIKELQQIG